MDYTLHRILDLLWKKGVTDAEFCNVIGINKSAVTDWKKGKTVSYKRHLQEIADYFEVEKDSLLRENPISACDEISKEEWEIIKLYRANSTEIQAGVRGMLEATARVRHAPDEDAGNN